MGGYAEGLGPFVWLIWVASVSVCLARRGTADRPANRTYPYIPLALAKDCPVLRVGGGVEVGPVMEVGS